MIWLENITDHTHRTLPTIPTERIRSQNFVVPVSRVHADRFRFDTGLRLVHAMSVVSVLHCSVGKVNVSEVLLT